jgi:hypothetical protein
VPWSCTFHIEDYQTVREPVSHFVHLLDVLPHRIPERDVPIAGHAPHQCGHTCVSVTVVFDRIEDSCRGFAARLQQDIYEIE